MGITHVPVDPDAFHRTALPELLAGVHGQRVGAGLWGVVEAGWLARLALPPLHPIPAAVLVLGLFGAVYLAVAALLGVPHARRLLRRASP